MAIVGRGRPLPHAVPVLARRATRAARAGRRREPSSSAFRSCCWRSLPSLPAPRRAPSGCFETRSVAAATSACRRPVSVHCAWRRTAPAARSRQRDASGERPSIDALLAAARPAPHRHPAVRARGPGRHVRAHPDDGPAAAEEFLLPAVRDRRLAGGQALPLDHAEVHPRPAPAAGGVFAAAGRPTAGSCSRSPPPARGTA